MNNFFSWTCGNSSHSSLGFIHGNFTPINPYNDTSTSLYMHVILVHTACSLIKNLLSMYDSMNKYLRRPKNKMQNANLANLSARVARWAPRDGIVYLSIVCGLLQRCSNLHLPIVHPPSLAPPSLPLIVVNRSNSNTENMQQWNTERCA